MIGLFFIGSIVSIIVLSILIFVRKYDWVYSGPLDVCKRRDQGALGAKKYGTLPPGQAPRGKGVFWICNLQML